MADNWLSNVWEWLVPGEDDQGMFGNIGDWWRGDDDYDDYESEFDDELLSDLGIDPTSDPNTWQEQLDALTDTIIPMDESQWTDDAGYEDWINSWLDATGAESTGDLVQSWTDEFNAPETGIFGGKWGPWLRNLFLGSGGTGGTGGTGTGTGGNRQGGGIMGLLNSLLGGGGQGGGGLLGGGGLGTLGALWALNKARKEGSDPGDVIPIGADAFSAVGQGGEESPIDYRVFNLQPALMPGVAYANVGKPEGMKYGGSVYSSVNPVLPRPPFDPRRHWTPPQPKKQRGYGQAQEGHGGMKDGGIASLEGPGDVTPAWLEPGEFVVTKKAVDNIGAQNLYKMMKEAEGRG